MVRKGFQFQQVVALIRPYLGLEVGGDGGDDEGMEDVVIENEKEIVVAMLYVIVLILCMVLVSVLVLV